MKILMIVYLTKDKIDGLHFAQTFELPFDKSDLELAIRKRFQEINQFEFMIDRNNSGRYIRKFKEEIYNEYRDIIL